MPNYAFIDSANVNLALRELGWQLDFKRFRQYLKDKHDIDKAYMFMGYMSEHGNLYTSLQNAGFILIFKPILKLKDGTVKGNCDAEMVLQAMIDYPDYDKALILTGDGDFHCLIQYLYAKKKLLYVMVPNLYKYSGLIKTSAREKLLSMNELEEKVGRPIPPHLMPVPKPKA